jgi:hypothetical protein
VNAAGIKEGEPLPVDAPHLVEDVRAENADLVLDRGAGLLETAVQIIVVAMIVPVDVGSRIAMDFDAVDDVDMVEVRSVAHEHPRIGEQIQNRDLGMKGQFLIGKA